MELVKSLGILHNVLLCEVGEVLLQPPEGTGHDPFLIEFQEVFTVSDVPGLWYHETTGEERLKYPSSYYFKIIQEFWD